MLVGNQNEKKRKENKKKKDKLWYISHTMKQKRSLGIFMFNEIFLQFINFECECIDVRDGGMD